MEDGFSESGYDIAYLGKDGWRMSNGELIPITGITHFALLEF
mgnify:CR=1 FL=1